MKRRGKKASMLVTKPGITCVSLGDVEVNDDSWCYWHQSRWGMSYNVDGKSWSGSTDSRWFTGPVHTEIELRDSSAGTVVCGGPALCDAESKEWRNDGNDAIYVSQQSIARLSNRPNLTSCPDHLQANPVWKRTDGVVNNF
jgi:hypothetical protein